MSSEVCPFCGKAYKRLKSHLPHCKAAPSSKTPPTSRDVTAPSQPAASLSDPAAEGRKSAQTLIKTFKKSKKVSKASLSPAASLSESLSASYPSLSSPKKTKQKSAQIETPSVLSSDAVSLISTPSLPPSPTSSKPRKKSLRALIEAAKSKEVSNRSIEGIRSASEDLPSGSTPSVANPLSSKATMRETKTNPDLIKESADPAFLPTDTKPKSPSKTKVLKTKTAAGEDTSSSLDSGVNESSVRSRVRDDLWVSNEWEISDSSAEKMKPQRGHQAKITLQNVKSVLGKANGTRKSSRPSILSQVGAMDDLVKVRPGVTLSRLPPQNEAAVDGSLVTSEPASDRLLGTSSQNKPKHNPKSAQRKSSKSKPASSPPPQVTSPPPGRPSPQVIRSTSPPHGVCTDEGLKAGRHMTGLLSAAPSLNQLSSPHLFPLAKQNVAARVEALTADDGRAVEKLHLELRKGNAADNGRRDALTQRRLAQVTLRELPEWLACKTPTDPQDVVKMVQRGWQWYYRRYIDVKRGGVGGLSMLLAGYCVLSYMWCYPHIKRDRWRKHH